MTDEKTKSETQEDKTGEIEDKESKDKSFGTEGEDKKEINVKETPEELSEEEEKEKQEKEEELKKLRREKEREEHKELAKHKTEKELRKEINDLIHRTEQMQKRISEFFSQINVHRGETNTLRTKRDEANEEAREISITAEEFKEKRNEANMEVSRLKEEREPLIARVREIGRKIKSMKKERDNWNNRSRGTVEMLKKFYINSLNKLLAEDLPLNYETQLFDNVFVLLERLDAANRAEEIHNKISSEYETMKQLNEEIDKNFEEAHKFYEESQQRNSGKKPMSTTGNLLSITNLLNLSKRR